MSGKGFELIETKRTPLRTYGAIERALKWGWTVRCRLLEIKLPVGGLELTVDDVRELDEDDRDFVGEFQVLTIQGWRTPTTVWAIRPAKKAAGRCGKGTVAITG